MGENRHVGLLGTVITIIISTVLLAVGIYVASRLSEDKKTK